MRFVKIEKLFLLIAGLGLLTSVAQADTLKDPLWQKAVAIADANRDWVPGLVTQQTEEIGKKGKAKLVEDMRIYLSQGEDGSIVEDVKCLKDGKEIKCESDEEEDDDSSSDTLIEFFAPEFQDKVTIARTDQVKAIQGKQCVAYTFEQEGDEKEITVGTAWLEETTGMPLEVQFTVKPLPEHVEKMNQIIRFNSTSLDFWYPEEMLIDLSAGMLIFKKHYHIKMDFNDYWRNPQLVSASQ